MAEMKFQMDGTQLRDVVSAAILQSLDEQKRADNVTLATQRKRA